MPPTSAPHDPAGPQRTNQRVFERRANIVQFRLFARIFTLRRTFGKATAYALMIRMGIDHETAINVLSIGRERRVHRRRG
jgi:hypothetical protein